MNESEDIVVINEISIPKIKLKDLIRTVWNKSSHSPKTKRNRQTRVKQLDLPLPKPEIPTRKSLRMPKPKQLALPFNAPEPPRVKPESKPKVHKSFTTEPEPKIEKPKVLSTLFSKKLDTSKPPFYQDADKWYKDNFTREDSQGYTYGVRYVGPTLDDIVYVFGKYPHDNNAKSFADFYDDREKNMALWNYLLKDKIKKKWPNEFAGMNESTNKIR